MIYDATARGGIASATEDKQINTRLENGLGELERVVGLSLPCHNSRDQSKKVALLNEQEKRLRKCEEIIHQEREQVS